MIIYKQLKEMLNSMSEDELSCTVTMFIKEADEFLPVEALSYSDRIDILDEGHPFFIV